MNLNFRTAAIIPTALALLAPISPATAKPTKKPVYYDCRPSEDIVNGRSVWKTVCQNQDGEWVEVPPPKKKTRR